MIDLILCDDNPSHNATLTRHLAAILPTLSEPSQIALTTTKAQDVFDYIRSVQPGERVYLLDTILNQPETGLDLCEAIHLHDPTAYVVYISAYPEYALECVQSHAFDFVLKPYTPERLQKCLSAVFRDMNMRKTAVPLIIKAGSRVRSLDQRQIMYIESQRENVTAHMATEQVTWRESMTKLLERMNPEWFEQIHRSYLVNRIHVQHVDLTTRELTLVDGRVLPVGQRRVGLFRRVGGVK